MLKVDYLKNEKSFRSEIKCIFPCFASALFYTYKQTSKNVANTTFKYSFPLKSRYLEFGYLDRLSLVISNFSLNLQHCNLNRA